MLRRGFTVMEVVMALGLLSVMLLFLSALFLRLLAGSEKANDLTAGTMLAETLLQAACQDNRFESSTNQRKLLYNRDGSQAEEFLYQVTCTRLSAQLYYVDVEVAWGGGSRAGQGRLRTRLGRIASP